MLPIMLNVENKLCTIVGGGNAAYQKAAALLREGARVRIVSMDLSDKFKDLDIEYIKKEYSIGDTKGSFLVIAATDDGETNRRICEDAGDTKLFLSVSDRDSSDFMFSAYAKSGDVRIAVSTNGGYPMLGAEICHRLECECKRYDEVNRVLSAHRKRILESSAAGGEKRRILAELIKVLDIEDIEEVRKESGRMVDEWEKQFLS